MEKFKLLNIKLSIFIISFMGTSIFGMQDNKKFIDFDLPTGLITIHIDGKSHFFKMIHGEMVSYKFAPVVKNLK